MAQVEVCAHNFILRMKTNSITWAAAAAWSLAGLLVAGALLLGAGCADAPNSDFEETVQINSAPANAKLAIDGVDSGTTPIPAVLGKARETHLVISKTGFVQADIYVHVQDGHLAPNPVDVKLRCELLPDKPGPDRAAELATCLENLKKYVAIGNIAPEDEAYAEAEIREFYK
jgi:hypothetical protein